VPLSKRLIANRLLGSVSHWLKTDEMWDDATVWARFTREASEQVGAKRAATRAARSGSRAAANVAARLASVEVPSVRRCRKQTRTVSVSMPTLSTT
jgi:hypothetical protein